MCELGSTSILTAEARAANLGSACSVEDAEAEPWYPPCMALKACDPGDWLDPADRAALHQALADSQEDIEAGRLIDAEEVLKELRAT